MKEGSLSVDQVRYIYDQLRREVAHAKSQEVRGNYHNGVRIGCEVAILLIAKQLQNNEEGKDNHVQ